MRAVVYLSRQLYYQALQTTLSLIVPLVLKQVVHGHLLVAIT